MTTGLQHQLSLEKKHRSAVWQVHRHSNDRFIWQGDGDKHYLTAASASRLARRSTRQFTESALIRFRVNSFLLLSLRGRLRLTVTGHTMMCFVRCYNGNLPPPQNLYERRKGEGSKRDKMWGWEVAAVVVLGIQPWNQWLLKWNEASMRQQMIHCTEMAGEDQEQGTTLLILNGGRT